MSVEHNIQELDRKKAEIDASLKELERQSAELQKSLNPVQRITGTDIVLYGIFPLFIVVILYLIYLGWKAYRD